MRCGALTHNYATNACCRAKKSDRSLNPADMTAPLRLLSRCLRPGVFRERKNVESKRKKRAACLASYAFAAEYAEGDVPKTSRKHVAKYVGWLKPTS